LFAEPHRNDAAPEHGQEYRFKKIEVAKIMFSVL
jgi:hypothetical protein